MKPEQFPEQSQDQQPGTEKAMNPQPEYIRPNYKGADKLKGKVAVITGGDSGIGRSVAVHFAREGANVVINYLSEDEDADKTRALVESEGVKCVLIKGDVQSEAFCSQMITQVVAEFDRLDILANNAAVQFAENQLEDITSEHLHTTFQTNVFGMFYLTQQALLYMHAGGRVINTTSVTGYRGSDHLIDYASTKGAIVSFTRSLAKNLAPKGILVNGVAPGPIWTPLIPATLDGISEFGQDTPIGRAGQPSEVGPAYVYLASEDSSYMTGQVLHINGGEVVGG